MVKGVKTAYKETGNSVHRIDVDGRARYIEFHEEIEYKSLIEIAEKSGLIPYHDGVFFFKKSIKKRKLFGRGFKTKEKTVLIAYEKSLRYLSEEVSDIILDYGKDALGWEKGDREAEIMVRGF